MIVFRVKMSEEVLVITVFTEYIPKSNTSPKLNTFQETFVLYIMRMSLVLPENRV